ncbi:MAG TPA: hypothetical protein VEZ90_05040 [Blastocatellia bacterium]|nr:hypothetical protein [Blastocatellia bacterium]
MTAEPAAMSMAAPRAYRGIVWGGLIAGAMDITAAAIQTALRGRSPVSMLQGIASGILGPRSFEGGYPSAAFGLAVHFLIAYTACAVFFLASRRLTFMVDSAVIFGPIYGVLVYGFMYFIVLPITFPGKLKYTMAQVCIAVVVHIVCVGLPIALTVRSYSK